jgi:hypothetical protein
MSTVQKRPLKRMPNPHAPNLIPRGQQAIKPQQPGQDVDIALPAGTNVARIPDGAPKSLPGQRKKALAASKPVADLSKPFQVRGANPFR